jgi:hypothetical protein
MINPYWSDEQVERYSHNKIAVDVLNEQGALICPFCGEGDFDKIGLKGHLLKFGCDIMMET